MPLWMNRLRSRRLLDAVFKYEDFPILVETWRECLNDEFDLDNLKLLLEELESGRITYSEVRTVSPSPFASGLIWQQTKKHMYEADTPRSTAVSSLSDDLFTEIASSSNLRPGLKKGNIHRYQEKLQRTAEGYSPRTPEGLLDWTRERVMIPLSEWQDLLSAIERDHGVDRSDVLQPVIDKIAFVKLPGAEFASAAAVESIPKLIEAVKADPDSSVISDINGGINSRSNSATILKYVKENLDRRPRGEELENRNSDLLNTISEWLFYYGPVEIPFITSVFGVAGAEVLNILETLSEDKSVVVDSLSEGVHALQVCDSQNLENLLRRARAEARPVFEALEAKYLPLFLADYQGLTDRGEYLEGLQSALEKLFGYPADVRMWEGEIFPSRLRAYRMSWLDSLMAQSGLMWFGCGIEKVSFCIENDFEVYCEIDQRERPDTGMDKIFPGSKGRYSYGDLLDFSGLSARELTGRLWESTWKGNVFNDSWDSVRKGVTSGFETSNITEKEITGRKRGSPGRWAPLRPIPGNWFVLELKLQMMDVLEEEELLRERVRQLLQRYGILFREMVERELPFMRWARIFRTLRIMELSGEVVCGHFFRGINGLQFMSQNAFQVLKNGLKEDAVYWMNACDPASLCGIKLEGLPYRFPRRIPSTHLVYHGARPVLISTKNGRELEFLVSPGSPYIADCQGFFNTLLSRDFRPLSAVRVDTVNSLPVRNSPYREALLSFGFKKGYMDYSLRRSHY
jgi:ATP-dependent Lhr-like helicase